MPSSSNLPSTEVAKVSNTLGSGLPEMMSTISQRIHTMEQQQVARYDKHDKELKEVKGLLITLIHHLTGGADLHPLAQRVVDEVDSAVVEAVVDGEPLTAPAPPPDQAKAMETPASPAPSLEYYDAPFHAPASEMPDDHGPSEAKAPQANPLPAIYALRIRRETSWDKPVRTEEDRFFTSSRDLSPLFKKPTPPSAPAPSAPAPVPPAPALPVPSTPVGRRVGIRRETAWNKPVLTNEDEIYTSGKDLNHLFPPVPAPSTESASFATPSRSGPSSAATSESGAQLPSPAYTPSPLAQTTTLPPSSPTEHQPQAPPSATKRGGEKRRHLDESSTEEGPSKRRKSARIGQDSFPSLSGPKASALKTKAKLRRNATQFL